MAMSTFARPPATAAGSDPLGCALRLVAADNGRDLVRYHALLADGFRGAVDGATVSRSADEDAVATARAWASHPTARVVVEDAEVVGGFVLLRYRVDEDGTERSGSSVLEIRDGRVLRSWRYGEQPRGAPARPAWTLRRLGLALLVALTVVGYTIYDELLLSTPVVVTSVALGPLAAFAIFTIVYGVGSFSLAMLAVRHYDRWLADRPGRLQRWLTHAAGADRWRWLTRSLVAGRVPAFLLASYALGPIVTVWALRSAGVEARLTRLAIVSSCFYAVTFVAGYAGLGALLS
jgi:hypothetical protein